MKCMSGNLLRRWHLQMWPNLGAQLVRISTCQLKSKEMNSNLDMTYKRRMPRTLDEMQELVNAKVESPSGSHLIKVALIGVPNCGKSTLANALTRWKVCHVSKKVHTTLGNTHAICNIDKTQMILLDTPGVITPEDFHRHKVGLKSHLVDPELSFHEVDLIAVIHDVANYHTRKQLHPHIIKLLALHPKIPTILILNKIDALKKSIKSLLHTTHCLTAGKLLNITSGIPEVIKKPLTDEEIKLQLRKKYLSTKMYDPKQNPYYFDTRQSGYLDNEGEIIPTESPLLLTDETAHLEIDDVIEGRIQLTEQQAISFAKKQTGWPMFQDVFMISAREDNGVDHVREYILACAYPSKWLYNYKMVTNKDPFTVVTLTLREKMMDILPREVPYKLNYKIQNWNLTESEVLEISVVIECPTFREVKLISSTKGKHRGMAYISKIATQEFRNIFCCEVNLMISLVSKREKSIPWWEKNAAAVRKGNRLAMLKRHGLQMDKKPMRGKVT